MKRAISLLLSMILIISACILPAGAADTGKIIAFCEGSRDIINDGQKDVISVNPAAPALKCEDETLIPLGFFSRYFSASVSRDYTALRVKMTVPDGVYEFSIGLNTAEKYDLSGSYDNSITMKESAVVINNETYIPASVAADILGMHIYASGDGIVLMSEALLTSAQQADEIAGARLALTGKVYTVPSSDGGIKDNSSVKLPTPNPTPVTATKTGVLAQNTALLTSIGGTSLRTLLAGDKVIILSTANGYHYVQTKGWNVGYIPTANVKDVKSEVIDMSMGFEYYLLYENSARRITYANGASGVTYTSSDKTVATVNADGAVTALKPGMTTITASKSGVSASYIVIVCRYEKAVAADAMKISDNGVEFIAESEGGMSADGRFHQYQDVSGNWTIGFGHLIKPSESFPESISYQEAVALLHDDLDNGGYVQAVNEFMQREGVTLTQNQFDALVSFVFNMGAGYFKERWSMFTLKAVMIAYKDARLIPAEYIYAGFTRYQYSGGVAHEGLYNRRMKEANLFLTN